MHNRREILKKAQSSISLDSRIKENIAAQQINLIDWIFKKTKIESGSKVLELCCGTGSQTFQLLDLVGEMGHIVALDISGQALKKLMKNVKPGLESRVTLIQSEMDDLHYGLEKNGLKPPFFDLAFCAYGLYYSNDAIQTLKNIKSWLKPSGRIIIIGPFGPNNAPLFNLLESAETTIPAFVKYTSSDFMFKEVVPWLTKQFETISIHTLINKISWDKVEKVIEYWKNTTFYDQEKLKTVSKLLNEHFKMSRKFINEKWVMMIEAENART